MSEPWMLDELAHAGAEHLDRDAVAGYDRKQGPVPDEAAVVDIEILRDRGLDEQATVVDLGAGTGRFAAAAAAHVGHVIAVDVSAPMLEAARGRAAAAGRSNITFVEAGFLTYAHEGPLVDAVHTRNALHQLPDLFKALALDRIAGILRPGGVLRLRDLILDCEPSEVERMLAGWFAHAADDPTEGYTADDLAGHVRDEFSTFRWLLEPMLDAAGFEIADITYRGSVYGAYTCVRR